MSIREEAKREAERRRPDIPADPPGTPGNEARFPTGYSYALERAMFVAGAVWAREQADQEPSERLMVAPAIQAVRDVLNSLEDWEIQDHALEEIQSAVDDIPDCESATAIPHEEHGEPSEAEVRSGAFVIDEGAMDSPVDYPLQAEAAMSLARDVLLAAQEVRRG